MKSVYFALILGLVATDAQAIKKCQDADGKWHYGDIAVRANAKIPRSPRSRSVDLSWIKRKRPNRSEQLQAEEEERMLEEAEANKKRAEEEEKAPDSEHL